jgi:hypothetical protein
MITVLNDMDEGSDPVVAQARRELDAALYELFEDEWSRFFCFSRASGTRTHPTVIIGLTKLSTTVLRD